MEKVYVKDFIPLQEPEAAPGVLASLQKQYPASPLVNIFCLRLLPPRAQARARARMLLTLPDVLRFHELDVGYAPVASETRPKPAPPRVTGRQQPEDGPLPQPVFVKHPDENHDNRQALIDQLIEKFSKDAPKIVYSPETHDAEANYGEESLEEDPNIVSETLAMIYAEQGCLDKAVRMYEILKLHFPEKSCYFAAQIEKLQKGSSDSEN